MGTLTQGATTVTLPDDLDFPDEFDWPPLKQTKTYSVTGALLVESGRKQTGRLITLQAGDNYAWMSRADVEALRTMLDDPFTNMTLVFRGVTYTVRFNAEEGAIQARPVVDFGDPDDADFWIVTLRFYVV